MTMSQNAHKDPYAQGVENPPLPTAFISRRLHSLLGLFIVLFLIEHLLTNSQAALFLGDDGRGFIDAVNFLHSLPYLQVIEVSLLAVPIGLHTWWGIRYVRQAQLNSMRSDGSRPSLPYARNRAFTWQRITSILLVIGIILHVASMRFYKQPLRSSVDGKEEYMVRVSLDPGLYTLEKRLGFRLYDRSDIERLKKTTPEFEVGAQAKAGEGLIDKEKENRVQAVQTGEEEEKRIEILQSIIRDSGEVAAVAPTIGAAMLLMVRDTFKSPTLCVLYTLFIFAAIFHACNGLWTFAITWGVSLTERARRGVRYAANCLMALLMFFGLSAIWLTYWFNLYN